MKKIMYIHHGGSQGGAPRSLSFLIDKLDKKVWDPYVLCCHDHDGNKKLFEKIGATFLYEKYMGAWHGSTVSGMSLAVIKYNVLHAIPTYFNMKKILKKVKPDIVHLNSTCLFLCTKAIKSYDKNIKIICHVREPLLPNLFGDILKINCNKYVDQYIAIEQFDANSLKPTNVPIEVIYNFVDFNIYNTSLKSNVLREELNLKSEDVLFLFLARIAKCNGALEMLQRVESLIDKNSNIHFCIVGADFNSKDEYFLQVQELANKYTNNVHIIGFRNDVPNVIASSDVLVVPFQEPHFARSIIEAGAMGVPSIASKIGGLDELVVDGKTGYFFNYKTFEGFEEKCQLLATDVSLRNALGNNAETFAKENFDAVKNSNRVFEIYDKV